MSDPKDIRAYTYEQLSEYMTGIGEKSFRSDQIFDWLHSRRIEDIRQMTNLPLSLRERLSSDHIVYTVKPARILTSKLDGTRKYIHVLHDGNVIETVLLKYEHGNSVCISSQVGCRMGCRFCASTVDGLVRNLSAGEMAAQVYSVEADTGERVSHVVVMGSGEPLDNYDAFTGFVDIITDRRGSNISGRSVTVSTCGLVPEIRKLAGRKYAITLALSLHAVTDEKRKKLMPVAKRYSLDEVIDACRYYYDTTGRRLTLEYSLIEGLNDTDEDADGLIRIARTLSAHVNLIAVNPIKERSFAPTGAKGIAALKNKLEKNNINVTIRREMGRDISGACGQLRRSFINENGLGDLNA
ncbi:MAG: 23S rRNA (adenine(2503)-C(2))-methyltransferase RlmN [Lachnospiraceae bacterium]|nr:23S rRNA (adenine(2503)-C(2))-methyltransferase RlmN [Lachnospiraceae bacterium]